MKDDVISRQKVIDALGEKPLAWTEGEYELGLQNQWQSDVDALKALPSVQSEHIQNNAVHLCDSCQYTYPTCPSHGNDAVFGDRKCKDNICACNKYRPISAQSHDTAKDITTTNESKKEQSDASDANRGDIIYRRAAIDALIVRDLNCGIDSANVIKELSSAQSDLIAKIQNGIKTTNSDDVYSCGMRNGMKWCISLIDDKEPLYENCPSAQPGAEKYEYHHDHTDCIWYRPEARNRCPVTCAQYRDGWNDAMNYIFRDGKGYRPYRRDKQYGE